jgi:hypothetical protein
MVNVSTIVYVLENLEGKDGELINLEKLLEEEEAYVKRIFGKLDDSDLRVNPRLVEHILRTASTF